MLTIEAFDISIKMLFLSVLERAGSRENIKLIWILGRSGSLIKKWKSNAKDYDLWKEFIPL